VARLHTELLRQSVLRDFDELMPEKIVSITNGITHRRWLLAGNPELAALLTRRLGDRWILNLEYLRELAAWQEDPELHAELRAVKLTRKQVLRQRLGDLSAHGPIPTDALYDVQAKRLHEYKRQLLNALQVASRYLQLADAAGTADLPPRVVWFAAKAAPGYGPAKLIIKFINNLAAVVNRDRRTRDRLQLYFVPDYRVTLAEALLPAADLSEQISLAGTEASGTGNMKLALNGALTIGTLDGATIEIRDAVGPENLFDFGLTASQAAELRRNGYDPRDWLRRSPELQQVLAAIRDNRFSPREHGIFSPLLQALTEQDTFMVCADFAAYLGAQQNVDAVYFGQPAEWYRRVVMNIANMGYFSSDRAVREYATRIWGVVPMQAPDAPQRV
jgi:starch phosphorylase